MSSGLFRRWANSGITGIPRTGLGLLIGRVLASKPMSGITSNAFFNFPDKLLSPATLKDRASIIVLSEKPRRSFPIGILVINFADNGSTEDKISAILLTRLS